MQIQHCHQQTSLKNRKCVVWCGISSDASGCRLLADANWTSEMERPQNNLTCRNFCTYFAVIVIVLLLGRDFACTCKPQFFDCNLYLTLPVFIIFVFILWTDRKFQRLCRHLCSSLCGGRNRLHTRGFLGSFVRHVIKAAFISVLWIIYVFLDGNWYICCMNDHSAQQAQLACKSEGSMTDEDKVLIAELKNKSRVSVVLIFTLYSVYWKHSECVRL